ncbi:hypothetical protein fugu_016270 [Takifugu bimaculatus]|uniref:Uncharacterized protein n=1 Tax=Takifugu bimaculatus TaxID=433685 RepID=A0A4Z2BWW6_9TELE|nr:hypothetical protein fugu_016270 [Takifugu bimaculatus]
MAQTDAGTMNDMVHVIRQVDQKDEIQEEGAAVAATHLSESSTPLSPTFSLQSSFFHRPSTPTLPPPLRPQLEDSSLRPSSSSSSSSSSLSSSDCTLQSQTSFAPPKASGSILTGTAAVVVPGGGGGCIVTRQTCPDLMHPDLMHFSHVSF